MEKSNIEWCDNTFNAWEGCVKVSPGCDNCYAESLSYRWGKDCWGKDKPRIMRSEKYWKAPEKWNARAEASGVKEKVFCSSMADVFENRPDLVKPRKRLFDLIDRTPNLIWQVLTKRPKNIPVLSDWKKNCPDNVWIGTSAEDQTHWYQRVPILFDINAHVRFVSVEPMLGPITIQPVIPPYVPNWVIVGGESAKGKHRPFDVEWARSLRDECKQACIPFFMKQVDKVRTIPDDLMIKEFPHE